MRPSPPVLPVGTLTLRFGTAGAPVVDSLSIAADRGGTQAIVGERGSGTTLTGLLPPGCRVGRGRAPVCPGVAPADLPALPPAARGWA